MEQYTQDFFTSRRNYKDGDSRIGQTDRLWYDSKTLTIRVGNGTPGGRIVGAGRLDDLIDTNIVNPKRDNVLIHDGAHWANLNIGTLLVTHTATLSGKIFTIGTATHTLTKIVSYKVVRADNTAEVSVVIKQTGLTFTLESNVNMNNLKFLITGFQ